MKKLNLYILSIIILAFTNHCYGTEIVYPKSVNTVIDSPVTAFIGNELNSKTLTINGECVNLHQSGAFKHPVELYFGNNTFIIDNGKEKKIYTIRRNQYITKSYPQADKPIFYDKSKIIITISDNVPLRSTPVDSGLNRLQHLQKGIELNAIGEFKDFYKVSLGRDDIAWVNKSQVKISDSNESSPVLISDINYNIDNDSETLIVTTENNKKLPYILSEGENGLDLAVYGVNDEIYPYGKYEFHIAHDGNLFGYSSAYNEKNELVININKNHKDLKDLKITIDPGHGGREFGAIGCLGDKEKDINLQIANKLKDKLETAGAKVFMTRTDDSEVSLSDRVKKSNENKSEIFISIHANALPDSLLNKDISGTEIYYFYPQAKKLAKSIMKSITKETDLKDNGVKGQSFAVVRNTNAVSILIEVGYIIDPDDNSKLIKSEFQNKAADAIVHGLENYLNDI